MAQLKIRLKEDGRLPDGNPVGEWINLYVSPDESEAGLSPADVSADEDTGEPPRTHRLRVHRDETGFFVPPLDADVIAATLGDLVAEE